MMVSISKIALILLVMLTMLALQLNGNERRLLSSKAQLKGSERRLLSTKSNASFFWPKVTVAITNRLTMKTLGLHCKDKHHDLGYHELKVGQTYIFAVTPKIIFKVTLYFCKFVWLHESHYFDIYVELRDGFCKDNICTWDIFARGPCKIRPTSRECFSWNKVPIEK
ncbi:hypothetical protein VNO78_07295 [Psophocarpus tetragonolobus]|uniref:S-protein homolog n=1 Tax=Psophocarpus tetragonolobus TaxID=3891 RepID=A0AAN9SVZ0_PSOTE